MRRTNWPATIILLLLGVAIFGTGYIAGREAEREIWQVETDTETYVVFCGCSQHRLTVTASGRIDRITQYDRKVMEEKETYE